MKNHKKLKHIIRLTVIALVLTMMITTAITATISADSSANINYFGAVVPCKKDSGYVPKETNTQTLWEKLTTATKISLINEKDNPHNGWSLGSFYVSGFSGTTKSTLNSYDKTMPVYLKNAGDTLSFGFRLDQDIEKLNGDSKLSIYDDKKMVQDCWVQDPYFHGDIGRGMLIVVHTDYKGEQNITTYKDFLVGKTVGANTEIQLFEEGDYRVVLCYEIYKNTNWSWIVDWANPDGSWYDYRIESYFSVRNGNAMVFPFDIETGNEVPNNGIVKSGFTIDLANSHYLSVFAKKENLSSNGVSLSEDTRFNKIVSDNTKFDQEGKYTISVVNQYTGMTTEKVIYVGDNAIMKCHVLNGLTIEQINELLAQGYTIANDGSLIEPPKQTADEASNKDAPTNLSANTPPIERNQASGCTGFLSIECGALFSLTVLATVVMCRRK